MIAAIGTFLFRVFMTLFFLVVIGAITDAGVGREIGDDFTLTYKIMYVVYGVAFTPFFWLIWFA